MRRLKKDLKVLLLQIRDQEVVRREEHNSFALYAGLDAEQIDILNVFDRPDFPVDVVDGYDGLLVGGASEASVLEPERYPFIGAGERLLLHCMAESVPVFASCFGFQLAVTALGGDIQRDQSGFEMGSIPIYLTAAAADDPLLADTPDGFMAVSVHRERTLAAPPGCWSLAYTDQCCHSFRVAGKPFWTFQFHPEVDKPTLVERLTVFKDKYTDDDAHLDKVLSACEDTPESNALVGKFVDRVLLG